jgi:type IV secretory pathway VirB4 component
MIICQVSKTWFFCLDVFVLSVSFLLVSPSKKPPTIKGEKMRKNKRNNSKLLKVVDNTKLSIETKKQQDEDRAYQEFNEKCKELIRSEIRELFENSKVDFGSKVYNFSFYLAQEFIFDKMPIGSYQRALNFGTKEAHQNYLEYLNNEYSIKPREVVDNEKSRTIN